MNKVCLLGRICADPAVKEINGKNKLADFTLAVDRGLSKEAKEKAKQTADFIRCKAWSQKAELIEKYFKKRRPTSTNRKNSDWKLRRW